jgi:hypothetical protein
MFSIQLTGTNWISTSPSLAALLADSFSFDGWVYIPTAFAANGQYYPIVSHQANLGADNSKTDFNLQLSIEGRFNFFMGGGDGEGYGIDMYSRDPAPLGRWVHLAFSVEMEDTGLPAYASLFVDGVEEAAQLWQQGSRQLSDSPVYFGFYKNDDSTYTYQSFAGMMDEFRFFSGIRHAPQILAQVSVLFLR